MYLADMPVNEAVAPSGACSYTVYINASLCPEARQTALDHALRHIMSNDWEQENVQEVEYNAHA